MNNFINPQITKQIIIGTKSQSRRKLFHSLNLPFKFRSANIDERKVKNINNNKYDALKIAEAKANHLSSKYKNKIIVAFDTIILIEGFILIIFLIDFLIELEKFGILPIKSHQCFFRFFI